MFKPTTSAGNALVTLNISGMSVLAKGSEREIEASPSRINKSFRAQGKWRQTKQIGHFEYLHVEVANVKNKNLMFVNVHIYSSQRLDGAGAGYTQEG